MPEPEIDNRMQVGYGSAWHLLRCLGFQRQRFNAIVSQATGATEIAWLDFNPYAGKQKYPKDNPILDGERTRLDFLATDHPLQAEYDEFWPTSGTQQNWDAVGQATFEGQREWLLVEAKAHCGEIKKCGTTAKRESLNTIRKSFDKTRDALGAGGSVDDWLNGYYQDANRLATLYFLNQHQAPSRLLLVYFCGDSYARGDCPTDAAGWNTVLADVRKSLGLSQQHRLADRIHEVFVPVDLAKVC